MPGRSSGEFDREGSNLWRQMNDVIVTLKGINSDLTTLKISDAVMEERVRNIAEKAARDVAAVEQSKQRVFSIWTLVFSILGGAIASYFVSLLLQSHK